MRIKSLVLGSLAAGLLISTSHAVEIWFVHSVDSASGTVRVESELCMQAFVELIDEQGFEFLTGTPLSLGGGQQGNAYLFARSGDNPDAVTLICVADREEIRGCLGKPGGPGGPGGPRELGCLG